jgi:hypothetical protein
VWAGWLVCWGALHQLGDHGELYPDGGRGGGDLIGKTLPGLWRKENNYESLTDRSKTYSVYMYVWIDGKNKSCVER